MKNKEEQVTLRFPSYSVEDYTVDNIKYITSDTIGSVVSNLYKILTTHATFKALKHRKSLKKRLVELATLQDYKNNLINMLEFSKTMDVGFDVVDRLKFDKLKQVSQARREFLELLKYSIEFVNYAIELENVKEIRNSRDYIKFLNSISGAMTNCVLAMAKTVDFPSVTNQKYGDDYKKIFEDMSKYLQENIELAKSIVAIERRIRKETEILEKEILMREQKSRAIEFEPNEKELKRQNLIAQTNAFYNEFCDDFLRDLEKQYSLSSRDMYEYFINVKFKNFVERYPMPIASDASEGYANEVFCQIQNLIEYISKISENSYVTSVYGEN